MFYTSRAIWYSKKGVWLLGRTEKIGGNVAEIYGKQIPDSGPHNGQITWHYRDNGWNTDETNDITVRCIETIQELIVDDSQSKGN